MNNDSYKTSIVTHTDATDTFNKINAVAEWWSEAFEGNSSAVDDIFTVRFGETYITLKVSASEPNHKIIWEVIDCHKPWLKDKKEWNNTKIVWVLEGLENGLNIHFEHVGLKPTLECYGACERAWNSYLGESLLKLLNEGKGMPEREK